MFNNFSQGGWPDADIFPGLEGNVQVFFFKPVILYIQGGEILTSDPDWVCFSEQVPSFTVPVDQV